MIQIEQKRSGWWIGSINGRRGYVPSNYLEKITD